MDARVAIIDAIFTGVWRVSWQVSDRIQVGPKPIGPRLIRPNWMDILRGRGRSPHIIRVSSTSVSRVSVYVKHTRNSIADVLNHPMKNAGITHGTALLAVHLHGVCQTSELTLELRLVFQHGEVGLLEDLLYISLPLPRRLLVHAEISVAQRLRANPCRVQHIVRIVRVLVAVPVRA